RVLVWTEFEQLLPTGRRAGRTENAHAQLAEPLGVPAAPPAVLTTMINAGLSHQDDSGAWTVRGDQLVFSVTSAVPASAVVGQLDQTTSAPLVQSLTPEGIHIRPLDGPLATSTLSVTLTDAAQQIHGLSAWQPARQDAALPSSLWGTPLTDAAPDPAEPPILL